MLKALSQGIGQLNDKATRKYLWFSVGAAVITFFILWTFIAWLLSETAISSIGWLEGIIDILGGLATAVLTWVLFPATVSAVIGFFLDQVAECVENKHYPTLPKADGQPVGEAIVTTAKFFGMLIGLNILLLPFLFFGPVYPVVFYAVNGYLIGREYFEMVAVRRVSIADATSLRKQHQGTIIMMGVAIAFLLTIPIVNLLMPVVATAAMVHLFHGWRPEGMARTPVTR
jgi:CysZ protein